MIPYVNYMYTIRHLS